MRTSGFIHSGIFLLRERARGVTHCGVYERPFGSTKYIRDSQNSRAGTRIRVQRIRNKRFTGLLKISHSERKKKRERKGEGQDLPRNGNVKCLTFLVTHVRTLRRWLSSFVDIPLDSLEKNRPEKRKNSDRRTDRNSARQ